MADLPRCNGQDGRTAEGASGSSAVLLEMSSSLASMPGDEQLPGPDVALNWLRGHFQRTKLT